MSSAPLPIRSGHRNLADGGPGAGMPPFVEARLCRLPAFRSAMNLPSTNVTPRLCGPACTGMRSFKFLSSVVSSSGVGGLLMVKLDRLRSTSTSDFVRTRLSAIRRRSRPDRERARSGRRTRRPAGKHSVTADAAARADRQPGHLVFLREVRRKAKMSFCNEAAVPPTARRLIFWAAEITIQERRRQIADDDVVEAMPALIGRKKRGSVDVERQQVSNRVLIFGSVQASQCFGSARIWFCNCRRRIERVLQPRPHRETIRLRRLQHVGRRHDARAELAHHLLPYFGLRFRPGHVDPVQTQAASLRADHYGTVAIAIQELTLAGDDRRWSGRCDWRLGLHLHQRRRQRKIRRPPSSRTSSESSGKLAVSLLQEPNRHQFGKQWRWRERGGGAIDPTAVYRASGYRKRKAEQCPAKSPSSAGIV